jgi:hypothetical protein
MIAAGKTIDHEPITFEWIGFLAIGLIEEAAPRIAIVRRSVGRAGPTQSACLRSFGGKAVIRGQHHGQRQRAKDRPFAAAGEQLKSTRSPVVRTVWICLPSAESLSANNALVANGGQAREPRAAEITRIISGCSIASIV